MLYWAIDSIHSQFILQHFFYVSCFVSSGFDTQFLAHALNIDEDTTSKLQAPTDHINKIVRVSEGLTIMDPQSPQDEEQEWQQEQQEQEEEPQPRGQRSHAAIQNNKAKKDNKQSNYYYTSASSLHLIH